MTTIDGSNVKRLIVACDAGTGPSVMPAARAGVMVPEIPVIPFQLFMGDPAVTKLVKAIQNGSSIEV